ncbi:hypothetical protein HU230_0012635 [Bradyrhizobium quebecense]|uniref:Uncharacterized protein n=1 Tax=Bradyrhizobium quebecense TaxID=2748629 RepID=A0A973WP01_9BRAD|nr:hypothetical protein [Bradyrhizobium quebecense]UGA46836.1 hypothetical protein HU230_0012635 [Bradyrhizobium quebecense]
MYSFEYAYMNPDDLFDTAHASRTVHADADLTEVLSAMRDFLQAAGFTYVVGLTAYKDDGTVAHATDIQ